MINVSLNDTIAEIISEEQLPSTNDLFSSHYIIILGVVMIVWVGVFKMVIFKGF